MSSQSPSPRQGTRAAKKRRVTDRVLNGLQEGTKSLIGTVERMEEKKMEMEEKKMDRFDQIISSLTQMLVDQGHGVSRVDAGRLEKGGEGSRRVKGCERQSGEDYGRHEGSDR